MNADLTIILICTLVAISGSLLGTFLMLRRMAMISDAISHSIVFGVAVGFLIFKSTDSIPMMLATIMTGLLTVWLSEVILRTGLVKEDASIGLVFPALFSIGVILINRLLGDIHIDVDTALVGEVIWAPFETINVAGLEISKALFVMSIITIVNLSFIVLLYKELKLATFDAGLAAVLGFSPAFIHYSLMTLLSVTAVGAFDAVGAILFIGFVIVPAATAYLLTDSLARIIAIAIGIGSVACVAGYQLAVFFDLSISGSIVMVLGIIFVFTLIFAPERGLVANWLRQRRHRWEFATHLLIGHLLNHTGQPDERTESLIENLPQHLNWESDFAQKIMNRAQQRGWVKVQEQQLMLTETGKHAAHDAFARIKN